MVHTHVHTWSQIDQSLVNTNLEYTHTHSLYKSIVACTHTQTHTHTHTCTPTDLVSNPYTRHKGTHTMQVFYLKSISLSIMSSANFSYIKRATKSKVIIKLACVCVCV